MSETLARASQPARKVSEEEAREIGIEAYHYLYPLVLMHVTRRVSTNYPLGVGPEGVFHHMREYSSAGFRPNFDTLYSMAWLDLTKGPYVISVPDTHDRYYVLAIHDMWTDVFASLGTRTSGTAAGHFAIVPRGWNGTVPFGMERIEAPTTHVWITVRTQTHGPKDYALVHKLQDGFIATPLSQWGRSALPRAQKIGPAVDVETAPMDQVDAMSPATFFNCAADLMTIETPHLTDWPILARMRKIGLEPGKPFHLKRAPAAVQTALAVALEEGHKQMTAKVPTIAKVVNGWQMNTGTIGAYGNHYLKRAIVAMIGLGALPPEDLISPVNITASDDTPANGAGRYIIHFGKDELPPARAFWSITMYDGEGFPVRNPISRYAVGDRDGLKFNSDGSLDIYIQGERPTADKMSNWLPSPSGPMGIVMRLYSPRPEALDGRWAPPVLQLLKHGPDGHVP